MICIWCVREYDKLSNEHVFPEGLGCPEDLILPNIACESCNSKLGRKVDVALVKAFEVLTVMYQVPRKGGKQPQICSWSAIASEHCVDGHAIFLNGGPGTIEEAGKKLHAASKSNGITDTWVKVDGDQIGIGFTQEFGNDAAFLPALFKIGLNLVANYYGPETAAGSNYDHIRKFVTMQPDAPDLSIGMEENRGFQKGTGAPRLFTKEGRPYPVFQFEILGVFFLLDMAPDQSMLRDLRGAATLMDESLYVFPTNLRPPTKAFSLP